MVKVKNVSKSFGNNKVIDNLSFELKKGDVTGLLGPNGAGKTTTMRMLASYYFPNGGNISIDNVDTQENPIATQQKIGYLPENNPLYFDMYVIDYLIMTANFYNVPKKDIEKNIKSVAKSTGIAHKLTSKIGELSKGYKQRVGIAAALVHEPSIVILDEPTEGLDPIQREEIRKLIKEISKDKVILISTHVMQEVKAMCNKVIVINNGKLVTEGDPEKLGGKKTLKIKVEGIGIEKALEKLVDSSSDIEIEDNRVKVKSVLLHSEKELRPEISKLAIKNNWIIWEMLMEDQVEEVFRELKS